MLLNADIESPLCTDPSEISSDYSLRQQRLKTLALNIIKDYPGTLISDVNIPELEKCLKCDKEILTNPKSITTLVCGHMFHRMCIEKNFMYTSTSACLICKHP